MQQPILPTYNYLWVNRFAQVASLHSHVWLRLAPISQQQLDLVQQGGTQASSGWIAKWSNALLC
jgi:hypothetical protein